MRGLPWIALVLYVGCGDVKNDTPSAPHDAPFDIGASDEMTMEEPDAADLIVDLDAADVTLDANQKVVTWPDRSGKNNGATATHVSTAISANVAFNGAIRHVVRFDGGSFLTAPPHVPAAGTLFVLYSGTDTSTRALGWESYATGTDGIGIITGGSTDSLSIIARKSGAYGDVTATTPLRDFELDVISWGAAGVTLERHKPGLPTERESCMSITSISDGGFTLHLGSSGDENSNTRFRGDLMLLRLYGKQLPMTARDDKAIQLLQQ